MVQLSPAALGNDMAAIELRMRELARTIPPTDIQLYYQTLLIGCKELPYAPDRRMGVEMTLRRSIHVCLCLSQKCHASPLRPSRQRQ